MRHRLFLCGFAALLAGVVQVEAQGTIIAPPSPSNRYVYTFTGNTSFVFSATDLLVSGTWRYSGSTSTLSLSGSGVWTFETRSIGFIYHRVMTPVTAGVPVPGTETVYTVVDTYHNNPANTTTVTPLDGFATLNITDRGEGDDLVVDFGADGVWELFDGDTAVWHQLHTASAKTIATGDLDGDGHDEVIIDFGPEYGIWVNNSPWHQLHTSTATRIVTGDLDGNGKAEILFDFPGAGIWVWANNTSWYQLHPSNSNNMVIADLDGNGTKDVIVDFPGFGIWVWQNDTAPWHQLHTLNSRLITAGDFDGNGQADLVVDFAGAGLWKYSNDATWSQVHTVNAAHLAAGDVDGNGTSDLIVDFGSAYGIWVLPNDTWTRIHTQTATNIVTADIDRNGKADVIVDFGAAGLWDYANNTNWTQLHTVSPGAIAVGRLVR